MEREHSRGRPALVFALRARAVEQVRLRVIDMAKPTHIFIVGLSRTGTTLTRNTLNCSPEVGMGGESMFFGDTRWLGLVHREGYRHKFARQGNLARDEGAAAVVNYIYGIRQNNFWSKIARKVQ